MRIGVNTLFLIPGEVGGSETYLCHLLRHFVDDYADVELVLFTNAENDQFLRDSFGQSSRVQFRTLSFCARNRAVRIFREQTQLPVLARRADIDVLWSPGYTTPCLTAFPQVTTVFDMQYKEFPRDWSYSALIANAILVPLSIRRSRRILTLSAFSRGQIMKYVPVDPDKIHVTHLAADECFSRPVPERTRRLRHIIPSEAPYLLCVANTYPHKNVPGLIETYGRLAGRIPHQLVLVGSPGRGESLVQEALQRLDCRDRIVRLNRVTDTELVVLYQGAQLFVFPSLYEGFGLPVLEAMMAGTPVLTTRRGAIPEIGGNCVSYFDESVARDLDDKVMGLLAMDSQQRDRWIQGAKSHAGAFSWTKTAELTMACLRQVSAGCAP